MKAIEVDSTAQVPADALPSNSLTEVLGQSEDVKGLVVEAAEELASVNLALKQGLAKRDPMPGVETALEKSEAVEGKVQEASEKLAVLSLALKDEVQERHVLEEQLAAVTEQGEAARLASLHDALTGLPNRALFDDRLGHAIAQAQRHGWPLAVMFVDLDGFKLINDTHGHDVGDSVLRTIASRLKAETRSYDTISRAGGDEFLYLAIDIRGEQDVSSIAEKLIESIQTPCEIGIGDATICLTVKSSVGVAIYPKSGATADALIKAADTAMYLAKRAGTGYRFAP